MTLPRSFSSSTAGSVSSDRAVRMLTVLLAACDPRGWIAQGGAPPSYAGLAATVASRLATGAAIDDLIVSLGRDGGSLEDWHAFARVAVDWWTRSDGTRATAVAAA